MDLTNQTLSLDIIPDSDYVFYRIHKTDVINDEIIPGAFKKRDDGMSVDWSKHGTAEDLLKISKSPIENGIVQSQVSQIRLLPILDVIHKPLSHNIAHSLIIGIPDTKVLKVQARLHLKRCFKWIIPLNR